MKRIIDDKWEKLLVVDGTNPDNMSPSIKMTLAIHLLGEGL